MVIPLFSMAIVRVEAQTAVVRVVPAEYTVLDTGLIYSINITIENVTNLYAWGFKLYYPNDILNGTSYTEGRSSRLEAYPRSE